MSAEYDTEKALPPKNPHLGATQLGYVDEDKDVKNATANRFGALAPALTKLFAIGVEARGVERVLEHERDPKLVWNK